MCASSKKKETTTVVKKSSLRRSMNIIRKKLTDSFEIDIRETSLSAEVIYGFVHFISCLFVLPVIPDQLESAGYDRKCCIAATAVACCVGCLLSSYLTNLPFVIAPPTAVSIFLSVAIRKSAMTRSQGDTAVMLSGAALVVIGIFKPLTAFFTKFIPDCIQASTAVGIGLITALAGAIELQLVVPGKFTILEMGPVTPSIVIAIFSTILIAVALHHHIKGAFISGMIVGTVSYWTYSNSWPKQWSSLPAFELNSDFRMMGDSASLLTLVADLLFLYLLVLSGIARSMSDLAHLTEAEKSIPRGNWLFIVCGLTTILSGYFSGPPILISPESAAGIKAGARSGLSTMVCGLCFGVSVFFGPLFSAVPPAGTTPLLILVGMLLFVNVSRIKWAVPSDAIPAFFVLLLIPFTYSILCGVGFGYVMYILIGLFTRDLYSESSQLLSSLHTGSSDGYEILEYDRNVGAAAVTVTFDDDNTDGRGDDDVVVDDGGNGDVAMTRRMSLSSPVRLHRQRAGSIVDKLPMDLSTNIHSMRA